MAIDELRTRLRTRLEEEYGVDEASILMDRPPGGWAELVTNSSLDEKLGRFAAELRGELRTEISGLRGELRTEVAGLRGELRSEVVGLRGELHSEVAGLRVEIADGFRAQTWRLVTAMAAIVAVFSGVAGTLAVIAGQ